MKFLFYILVIILPIIAASCSFNEKPYTPVSPIVNVLLDEKSSLILNPHNNYLLTINSRKDMGDGPLTLSLSNDLMLVNGSPTISEEIEVQPSDFFEYNGKTYRGSARIIIDSNRLMLINCLNIESYLYDVLPGEMSTDWDIEALKSQAVVSRTYALYERTSARKNSRAFDLYNDTRSQVYLGISCETKNTTEAVDDTQGEVIRYQGKIIESFFHSDSGGMTESSKDAFGYDRPYLVPVESAFADYYKDNNWNVTIPLEKLAVSLKMTNSISSISVIERTASKRLKIIEVADSKGAEIKLTGLEFRDIVGESMKSTRANIRLTNNFIIVSGVGSGHGVGMGQWDAEGMADKGWHYNDIISFFYRGTSIDKIW